MSSPSCRGTIVYFEDSFIAIVPKPDAPSESAHIPFLATHLLSVSMKSAYLPIWGYFRDSYPTCVILWVAPFFERVLGWARSWCVALLLCDHVIFRCDGYTTFGLPVLPLLSTGANCTFWFLWVLRTLACRLLRVGISLDTGVFVMPH